MRVCMYKKAYRPAATRAYMRACLWAQKTCPLSLTERAAAAESASSDEMTYGTVPLGRACVKRAATEAASVELGEGDEIGNRQADRRFQGTL